MRRIKYDTYGTDAEPCAQWIVDEKDYFVFENIDGGLGFCISSKEKTALDGLKRVAADSPVGAMPFHRLRRMISKRHPRNSEYMDGSFDGLEVLQSSEDLKHQITVAEFAKSALASRLQDPEGHYKLTQCEFGIESQYAWAPRAKKFTCEPEPAPQHYLFFEDGSDLSDIQQTVQSLLPPSFDGVEDLHFIKATDGQAVRRSVSSH